MDIPKVQVLDLEAAVPGLTCFSGGFAESTWGYAIPRHGSVMARFDLVHFTLVEALDLRATDSHLHDCFGGVYWVRLAGPLRAFLVASRGPTPGRLY